MEKQKEELLIIILSIITGIAYSAVIINCYSAIIVNKKF